MDLKFGRTYVDLHTACVCMGPAVATINDNHVTDVILVVVIKYWFNVVGPPQSVQRRITQGALDIDAGRAWAGPDHGGEVVPVRKPVVASVLLRGGGCGECLPTPLAWVPTQGHRCAQAQYAERRNALLHYQLLD